MGGTLGAGQWTAAITEPGGRMVWASTAAAVRDFSFGREPSEMSSAALEVAVSGSAGLVEPWLHALTIFYDDDPAPLDRIDLGERHRPAGIIHLA